MYRDNIERAHSLGVRQADAPVYLIIWGRKASYARAMASLLSDLQMDTATRCAYPHGRFMVSWTAVTDVPGDIIDAATDKLPGSVPFAQWSSGQVRGQPGTEANDTLLTETALCVGEKMRDGRR